MKKLLTVRVTVLESFRQWINAGEYDDKPWLNEANVIKSIQGEYTGSIKADFGTSGHLLIENAPEYRIDGGYRVTVEEKELSKLNPGYVPNVFTFSEAQAHPMIKFRSEHQMMTREIALSKVYSTPHFDLVITGTCDHMEGTHQRDTKFKFSSFDVQDFINSIQYKLYLDMSGMNTFFYDFFKVSGFETLADMPKAVIAECDSMMLRRYNGMENDIQSVINEFADWVVFKELTPWLAITHAKKKRILAGDSQLKQLIG